MSLCCIRRWLCRLLVVMTVVGLTADLALAGSRFSRANRQAPQSQVSKQLASPRTVPQYTLNQSSPVFRGIPWSPAKTQTYQPAPVGSLQQLLIPPPKKKKPTAHPLPHKPKKPHKPEPDQPADFPSGSDREVPSRPGSDRPSGERPRPRPRPDLPAGERPRTPADHPPKHPPVIPIPWGDPSDFPPIPLPKTDLAAVDCGLGGMYTDSSNTYQYWVSGEIKNVGKYHYSGGRTYTICAWVGASITLKTGPIPPLAPGETIEVKYWLPKGNKYTKFYAMITPHSDPNPSNDVAWSK